jgi:hypothetical protein
MEKDKIPSRGDVVEIKEKLADEFDHAITNGYRK